MNIQTISIKKPENTMRDIILVLNCVECGTNKPFKITESLKNLLVRNSESISYESKCEECGHTIKCELKWESYKKMETSIF